MAESVDALVSNTQWTKVRAGSIPGSGYNEAIPHYGHQTIVGIALLAVGCGAFIRSITSKVKKIVR